MTQEVQHASNFARLQSDQPTQVSSQVFDELVNEEAFLAYAPDRPFSDGPGLKAGIQDILKDNIFRQKVSTAFGAIEDEQEELKESAESRLTYLMLIQFQKLKQKVGEANVSGASKMDAVEAGYLNIDELESISIGVVDDLDEEAMPGAAFVEPASEAIPAEPETSSDLILYTQAEEIASFGLNYMQSGGSPSLA